MTVNNQDGQFQASYWRDAAAIGGAPDTVEYSDFVTALKDRIQKLLRRREFQYAAIFRWNGQDWELLEEFAHRDGPPA